jgi:hypothetical protein
MGNINCQEERVWEGYAAHMRPTFLIGFERVEEQSSVVWPSESKEADRSQCSSRILLFSVDEHIRRKGEESLMAMSMRLFDTMGHASFCSNNVIKYYDMH